MGFGLNSQKPLQEKIPHQIKLSKSEEEFVEQKLAELITEGSICELSEPIPGGWINNFFLVEKKRSHSSDPPSYRFILNMAPINFKIVSRQFKMSHIHNICKLLKSNQVMLSLDISSAFSHMFLHPSQHKFTMFYHHDRLFCMQVLPQGRKSSPRIYTRVISTAIKHLRRRLVNIVIYIDDSLLIGNNPTEIIQKANLTIEVLQKCGFIINFDKSHLTPTTKIEFLGFILDSVAFTISLTKHKSVAIKKKLNKIIEKNRKIITIRHLSEIIGTLIATFPCSDKGKLHYRILERFKVKMLQSHGHRWDSQIELSYTCMKEILWWRDHIDSVAMVKSLAPVIHNEEIGCDASKDQFGGWWKDKKVQSKFREKHAQLSINSKELLAIYFTLCTFACELKGSIVKIYSDSTTAIQCIKNFGSRDPFRDRLTVKIYELIESHNIKIMCEWLSSQANFHADRLSRESLSNSRTMWTLPQEIFDNFSNLVSWKIEVDLMASHLNNRVDRYCSQFRDPHAFTTNAFSLCWTHLKSYCFPPFSQIDAILSKIEEDQVRYFAPSRGSTLVPEIDVTIGRSPNPAPTRNSNKVISSLGQEHKTQSGEQNEVDFKSFVSHLLQSNKISARTTSIIANFGWRTGTIKGYTGPTKRWVQFCQEKGVLTVHLGFE